MVCVRRPAAALARRAGPSSSKLKMPLRYGENPHQQAALYLPVGPAARGVAQAEQVQGKELSYNNLNDANAALELVAEFRDGRPDHRHRQARQSVRRRHARHACSMRGKRRSPATASRRSAGSSPPTARSTPRPPKRSPTIFTEVVVAPDADEGAKRDLREEEESAPAAHRRAARSGARRPDGCA